MFWSLNLRANLLLRRGEKGFAAGLNYAKTKQKIFYDT